MNITHIPFLADFYVDQPISALFPSVQIQKLRASDAASGDQFGRSTSMDGSGKVVLIGAAYDDDRGNGTGAAYLFEEVAGVWVQQHKFVPSDGTTYDYFGTVVSLSSDGNTALISSHLDDDNGDGSGSVYVFVRTGSVWTQQQKLTDDDGVYNDLFGMSLALSGDGNTAFIGVPRKDNANGVEAGSVYVFTRDNGVWTLQQKLVASDGYASQRFGGGPIRASSDGSLFLVGASNVDNNTGAVYAFARSGSSWVEQQILKSGAIVSGDRFGISLDMDDTGKTAIIGARYADPLDVSDAGCAFVFRRSGSIWTEHQRLVASDGAASDQFGAAVSISGNGGTIAVGSYTSVKGAGSGSVYVYTPSEGSMVETRKLLAADGATDDFFGASVSLSANGGSLIVGAHFESGYSGSAYIFGIAD